MSRRATRRSLVLFQAPPLECIEERLAGMREVLEARTERSALERRNPELGADRGGMAESGKFRKTGR